MSDIVVDPTNPDGDTLFPTFSPTKDPFDDEFDVTFPPTETTPTPTLFPTRDGTPTPTESFSTFPPTRTFEPTYITTTMPPEPDDEAQAILDILDKEKEVLEAAEEAANALTEAPTGADSEEDSFSVTNVDKPPPPTPQVITSPVITDAPTSEVITDMPTPELITDPPTPSPTRVPPTKVPTPAPTAVATPVPTAKPTTLEQKLYGEDFNGHFVGFQSDWGPTYPGSMVYDFSRNSIYMTGTTFRDDENSKFQRSACFLGEVPVWDVEKWNMDTPPLKFMKGKTFLENRDNYKSPQQFDEREIMACHVVHMIDDPIGEGQVELYVGGVAENDATKRNGVISPLINTYGREMFQPHWQLRREPFVVEAPKGGPKRDPLPAKVEWPVAMASGVDHQQEDVLIVLVIASDDGLLTEEYIENHDANNAKNFKNSLLPPGREGSDPSKYAVPKRGSNYYFSYHRYHQSNTPHNPPVWVTGRDAVTVVREGSEVMPSGMGNLKPKSELYAVVGTIKGKTPKAFYMKDPQNEDGSPRLDDYDGFATGIDLHGLRPSYNRDMNIRFKSMEQYPPLDDFVHGMCMPPVNPDVGEIKAYYVVGSTWGTMPRGTDQTQTTTNILDGYDVLKDGNNEKRLSAWISKIDVRNKNNRSVVWTTQLFDTMDGISFEGGMTEAYGCAVVDVDKTKLYVAGTVYNGGIMNTSEGSKGGDDVWVAQLNSDDGSISWIQQIGSKGDDKLARSNGIVSDSYGHAIVFGETNGELYRDRSGEKLGKDDGSSTDVFVTTLDFMTGASMTTVETDRGSRTRHKALVGSLVTVFLVLACLGVGMILKWRRAQKYAAKSTDGVLKTNGVFHDRNGNSSYADTMEDNIAPQALSEPPPAEAFTGNGAEAFNGSGTFTDTSTNGDDSGDNKMV